MSNPILLRLAAEPDATGHISRPAQYGHMDLGEGTIRDESGKVLYRSRDDRKTAQTDRMLTDWAAREWNQRSANASGHDIRMRDTRDRDVLIKCELAPTDVHLPSNLPGYAAGYQLADGVADAVCPVVMVPKEEDKFWTWNSASSFNRALPIVSQQGGQVTEVQPAGGFTPFTTTRYALGAFVPTELTANQDAPIDVNQKVTKRVLEALRLERELRVMNLATTSTNFASANVRTLASTFQWNGGASSQPIVDMQAIAHASAMDISTWVMSTTVYDYWSVNPNVQKFIAYKQGVQAVPNPDVNTVLRLAPIRIAGMKYNVLGSLQYVWPSAASASAAVAFRVPPRMPVSTQDDIATMFTGRWSGGAATVQGATPVAGGFMIRRWFREDRGPLGGQMVVLTHADAEVFTSSLVGGIIVNPIQ